MTIFFRNIVFSIFFLTTFFTSYSQGYFRLNNEVQKQSVSFKLLSNLIVFPIEVNGKELNFILDSGVGATILFNLKNNDSIQLRNLKKIKLKGLGSEEAVDAILSNNNFFKFKNITGFNQKLYVIFDDSFDLSSKLGITIHGIIGYEILKDFVVNINYSSKKMTFYNPNSYKYKKCRNCETFYLEFNKLKPYVNVGVKLDENSNKTTPVKLLIDSGGSDAMWLFENSHPDISPPEKYFEDFLGAGLSGNIHGKRAFIKSLVLGKFELNRPTISYPDSTSIVYARQFEQRNGSLGGVILKRFNVIFDYGRSKLTLKKTRAFYEPFRYNMSGIELAYNGKVLVQEKDDLASFSLADSQNSTNNKIVLDYNYKYTFKPSYIIQNLRVGSPAYEAGLEKGDIVIKIDGRFTHEMELEEIVAKFFQKENKKVSIVVERFGQDYEYHFRLRDMLK